MAEAQMMYQDLLESYISETDLLTQQGRKKFVTELNSYLTALSTALTTTIEEKSMVDYIQRTLATPKENLKTVNGRKSHASTINHALSQVKNNDLDIKLVDLVKIGYLLLSNLRTYFTGETLMYKVGFQIKGEVHIGTLSEQELLSHSYLTYSSGAKGDIDKILKLRIDNSIFRQKVIQEELSLDNQVIITAGRMGSTVWSAVKKFEENFLQSNNNYGLFLASRNAGRRFEVYNLLTRQYGYDNRTGPTQPNFYDNMLSAYKSVYADTAAWTSGGDFLNESLKWLSGGDASLIQNISFLKSKIILLRDLFNNTATNKQEIRNTLTNLFLKKENQLIQGIEEESYEKALQHLDQVILNLK